MKNEISEKKICVKIDTMNSVGIPKKGRARLAGKQGGIPQGWETKEMDAAAFYDLLLNTDLYGEGSAASMVDCVVKNPFNDWIFW